jgi:hypothetical protein
MRALARPVFILLDEADFFPKKEQDNSRIVAERYIAKSDPYILMVSTPNNPGGLFEEIEREQEETCIYNRLELGYRVGLGKIYTKEEIDKAKKARGFEREYNLQYGHGSGNIFDYEEVNACIDYYSLAPDPNASASVLAVDPGYGSSYFGIIGADQVDGILYVRCCYQFKRPTYSKMLDGLMMYARDYPVVLVDSAHPGMITDLRERGVDAQPVNFAKELSNMTSAAATLVEEKGVRIHPVFEDLQKQLKSVIVNERGHPDKRKGNTFDLGDCLFMIANYFRKEPLYVAKI